MDGSSVRSYSGGAEAFEVLDQASVCGTSFGSIRPAAGGDAEVQSWSLGSALGLVALGTEEGEGEVDAFDLTDPTLGFGLCAALQKVGFQLGESGEHLGVDVEHWAADVPLAELVWAPFEVNS
ncbi:hypothetical protein ACWCW2_17060 [Streptomyces sp. NPDC001773]